MAKRSSFLLIFAFILFLMISNSFNACEGGAKLSPNFDFTWTLIYPSPTYEPLHSIAYGNYLGNDTFVAVGGSGTIVVSRDGGSTWKLAKSPTSEYLNKVVYGNNTFVAVGDKGTIVVSSDGGNNWIKNTFEPHLYNIDLYDIAYGGNTFAAVGYNYDDSKYCIVVSTDGGKTWHLKAPTFLPNYYQDQPYTEFYALNSIAYGNNTFVAVGGNGAIAVSTDKGNTWKLTRSPLYYIADKSRIYYYDLNSVAYGNNTFVAVAGGYGPMSVDRASSVEQKGIVVSTDGGKTWKVIDPPDYESSYLGFLWSISYGKNIFVALGFRGAMVTSYDNGNTWKLEESPVSYDLLSVAYGKDTVVAVGDYGTIVVGMPKSKKKKLNTSSNSWKLIDHVEAYLNSAVYGNNTFVAVGNEGKIVVSGGGGDTWKLAKSPTSKNLNSIAYGNNTFVAVGQDDTIVVSNDNGDSWKYIKAPTNNPLLYPLLSIGSNTLSSIAYGNSTFVAVGYKYELLGGIIGEINGKGITGAIVVSEDSGKSWRYIKSPNSKILYSIAYGNNNFVAVGYNDTIVIGKPSL